MKLKKITLNNIRSYENQEVNFVEGSTLLSGDIGSGKTSILLGIEFALFGLQPGQRGASLLRNGADFGKVIIEFEIDEKKILIERTLKKAKTISQDYCSITIDGEKKEISVTELKSLVIELLNYPKEFAKKQNLLYKFTVYTPQEEMKQIILQDSETRINTIRHVFGVDKYKRVLENVSTITSKIREEKRMKEGLTANLEQQKFEVTSKKNELGEKFNALSEIEKEFLLKSEKRKELEKEKEEIYKKIEEKNKLKQEIEKTNIMISNKRETVFNNNKQKEEINKQIDELSTLIFDESKISDIESQIASSKIEKEKFNEKIIDINSKINSLTSRNEDMNKIEQKLSNLEVCPTCLQSVEAVYRANVLNKFHNDLNANNNEIEILGQEKSEFSEKINKINLGMVSLEKELNDLRIIKIKLQGIEEKKSRIEEIEKSSFTFEKDMTLLTNHLTELKDSISQLEKTDLIFEVKQKQLEEAQRQERIVEIKIAELRKEIEVFSMQIEELKKKIEDTEKVKEKLDYLIHLESWLSKKFAPLISFIEKNVMIKLKSEFSKLFAKWFGMLVSESFNVYLRDDFTPVIEQQDYEIDYAYLSGGERTAIALAYRLALNQVINSLLTKIKTRDFIILDEPTDGFSDQQLDKIREVLDQLNVKQLIIVSHEQKIEGFVENVIRFKKEGGISKKES